MLALFLWLLAGQPSLVNSTGFSLEFVAGGFFVPVQMVFLDQDDILVAEQRTGFVTRVQNGTITATVLDLPVNRFTGQTGLLGLALHPQFDLNGWVYVHYTESSTGDDSDLADEVLGVRTYRYDWNGSTLTNPLLIANLPMFPGTFNRGGLIRFGPDGKLYITTGDQSQNEILQNNQLSTTSDTTSVILRLNDDGTLPPDNPFAAQPGFEAFYAYGVRNSYGLDFDPLTNSLWMSDNGPSTMDELNLVPAGFNGGWIPLMGPDALDPEGTSDLVLLPNASYGDPVFSWNISRGVTAVEFFRSSAWGTEYENDLFVADVVRGDIVRLQPNAARNGLDSPTPDLADGVADDDEELAPLLFATGFEGGITDLKTGPDGHLYVLAYNPTNAIYRVRRDPVPAPAARAATLGNLTATPNPFNPTTTVTFELSVNSSISWKVFNTRGQCVFASSPHDLNAGRHELVWRGTNTAGHNVASGVYEVRVRADDGEHQSCSVALIR